jgi:hypothetical protein
MVGASQQDGKNKNSEEDWNPIRVRSKGCPKQRWRDEVLNELKKLKVKNWTYLVKEKPGMN